MFIFSGFGYSSWLEVALAPTHSQQLHWEGGVQEMIALELTGCAHKQEPHCNVLLCLLTWSAGYLVALATEKTLTAKSQPL